MPTLSLAPLHMAVAAGVATLGLLWFRAVLKDTASWPLSTRRGVFGFIWIAYFILVLMFIGDKT